MRKMKALSLLLAAALTVSSVAVNDTTADAAKKPKLSKSKVSITVGQKYKIKLKNGAKKAKVTWKTSKKSTVKIVKKSTKGKAAFAQVKGVKKGKAVITASYKLGKSKAKTLKCTVTVKKAAPVNTTNAPATSAAVTTPTSPAKNTASAAPSKAPENSKSPEDTKAPDKTAKPTRTPKPTATVKPSAEPNPDLNPDVIDIMELTYLDLAEGIVKTDNADGSVTLDFTGTSYKGARWYFGTAAADEDSEPVQKALNLENYSYVVVEGVNQAGLTADENGKMHDLSAQFLDALDHADHGGLLEIDTQANFAFPIKFDLTDAAKRTNVAAFEIYSLGDDQSVKAGPITVKSIKAYKDKATYDKIMAEGDATPEPSKTPAPTADPANSYIFDLTKADTSKCDKAEIVDGALKITANDTAQGKDAIFNIPAEEVAKQYTKMTVEYSDVKGDFSFKYRAQDETKRPSEWGGYDWAYGDAKYLLPATAATKTITFREDAVPVDQVVFFNVNSTGSITIKSVTLTDPKNPVTPTATPEPTETAAPTETPATPVSIDLSTATKIGDSGTINYNAESKVLELSDAEGALIRIGRELPLGTKVNVTINGEATDGFRAWLSQGEQNASAIVNPVELGKTYEFTVEDFQSKGSTYADTVQIKGLSYGAKIGSLKITSIKVEEIIPATPAPVNVEAVETQITVSNNHKVVLSSDIIPATKPEWFFVDPATNVVDNGMISFGLVTNGNPANSLFFNEDKSGVELSDYQKVVMVLSSDVAGAKLRAIVSK